MKMLLAATTALVSVASIALAGPLPAREHEFSHYGLDANDTFLCDYGGFDIHVMYYWDSFNISHPHGYDWTHAAVPVKGKGETVSEIMIADELVSAPLSGYPVSVAIFSSRHNQPFKKLVSTSATASSACGTTISIFPIKLKKGKKYWIVEGLPVDCSTNSCGVFATVKWFYATTRAHGALYQTHSSCSSRNCHHSSTSPWEPITGGTPYVKLISNARKRDNNVASTDRTLPDHGTLRPPNLESGDSVQFQSHAERNRDPP
jgi:hypothetical protein